MAELPRLNGIIGALERGLPAFAAFCTADMNTAVQMSATKYDGLIFEMEHNPFDIVALGDALQYMINRAQVAASGSVAAAVTPLVRIPPNGGEHNQFFAKQVLDIGVYGTIWPHISTADQAYNAVAACRYPRLKEAPLYEPAGIRGDSPTRARRYWGISQKDYYRRADVWPLDPQGELFVILMIEDTQAIANLDEILRVPGIGAILIGEGDLSQELGFPREYEHPQVLEAMAEVVGKAKKHNVVVGHPHVRGKNVERVLAEGYRFLIAAPATTYGALDRGLELSGRAANGA